MFQTSPNSWMTQSLYEFWRHLLTKQTSDRSLFIAGGGGEEDFGEDYLILRTTKGGITENFGRIQRGHHSNLLGK